MLEDLETAVSFSQSIRSNKLKHYATLSKKLVIITRTLHERANHWNNQLHNSASQGKIDKTVVRMVDIVMNTFIGGSVERLTGLIGR